MKTYSFYHLRSNILQENQTQYSPGRRQTFLGSWWDWCKVLCSNNLHCSGSKLFFWQVRLRVSGVHQVASLGHLYHTRMVEDMTLQAGRKQKAKTNIGQGRTDDVDPTSYFISQSSSDSNGRNEKCQQFLSDDDFEIKLKIYNCLTCFIHILNYKMTLFLEVAVNAPLFFSSNIFLVNELFSIYT